VARWSLTLTLATLIGSAIPAGARDLQVIAPPSLEPFAARLRKVEWRPIAAALADAGLDLPATVRATLIDEDDTRAGVTPWWIVGLASGMENIVIFPARVGSYPYESLEAVLRHEVVHLALSSRAGGHDLPRWFHEGVAVSVETGWNRGSDLRLLIAAGLSSGTADLARLFAADTPLANAEAYRLATALVTDLRERHGRTSPGRIAARVAGGVPFARAYELETGETPELAAARLLAQYRRWTAWLPVVTSESALWMLILALACVAFVVRSRKRARRRRQWEEEELARE
jgi:hypothetical protein